MIGSKVKEPEGTLNKIGRNLILLTDDDFITGIGFSFYWDNQGWQVLAAMTYIFIM